MDSNSHSKVADLNSILLSSASTPIKIKTSKKWVLPPRPKPGRKPSQCGSAAKSDSSNNQNSNAKDCTSHSMKSPNSSGNNVSSRSNSESHILNTGAIQKKTVKKKERKPSVSLNSSSSPVKLLPLTTHHEKSIASKGHQVLPNNVPLQQKTSSLHTSNNSTKSSLDKSKLLINEKVNTEIHKSNNTNIKNKAINDSKVNISTNTNTASDAPNWDDESILKDPVKQKILKINEENYYLKLQVIKLVSDLKKLKKQNGTSVTSNDNKSGGNKSSTNNAVANKVLDTATTTTNVSVTNSKISTEVPVKVNSTSKQSTPTPGTDFINASVTPGEITSSIPKRPLTEAKQAIDLTANDPKLIPEKPVSVKLENNAEQNKTGSSAASATSSKVKDSDVDDLILSLIDLNHSTDKKQTLTQSPQTPQRSQFQHHLTPRQHITSATTSPVQNANKSKLIDLPSTNVVTEIYDELSIFNNLIIKNNSKLKVFANNYDDNDTIHINDNSKKRSRDNDVELEHDSLQQKKKLETGLGYNDFSGYDGNSSVISAMLSPPNDEGNNSLDSPLSPDTLTTTTPSTLATTTGVGSNIYDYDNDYYGFGDANEVEVEFENFINGRLI